MAEQTEFAIGTDVSCTDGVCGEVRRIVIDPANRAVTHLVIEPKRRHETARLVPLDLVDIAEGELRLRCTIAEFGTLDAADERDLVEGRGAGISDAAGTTPIGIPHTARVVIEEVVPLGETQVRPGDRVHAVDGEIGQVLGFLVDPEDRVTHVLLKEGHLWGRKEVAIPVSAVTGVDRGIRLSLTKQQVEELPARDRHRPFG